MRERPHGIDLFEAAVLVPPLTSAIPAFFVDLMARGVIAVRAGGGSFTLVLHTGVPMTSLEWRFIHVVFGAHAADGHSRTISISPGPGAWHHWDQIVRRLQVAAARQPRARDRAAELLELREVVRAGRSTGSSAVDEQLLAYALLWGAEREWLTVLSQVPAWWAEVSSLEHLPDAITDLMHALVAMPAGDGRVDGDPPDTQYIRVGVGPDGNSSESAGWRNAGRYA